MLDIFCKNTRKTEKVEEGSSLLKMLGKINLSGPYPFISAKVNNVSQGLKFRVFNNRPWNSWTFVTAAR